MSSLYLPLLFSLAAFLVSVVSLFYFRSYLKRRTGQERLLSELKEEVNNILKSIDETTERDISLIEAREENLKALLKTIEARLAVYVREAEKGRAAEEAAAILTPKRAEPSAPLGQSPREAGLTYGELGKRRYLNLREEIPTAEESPAPAGAPEPVEAFPLPRFRVKPEPLLPEEKNPPLLPIGEQVRELVRAGFTAPVIAARLGISIAEAEFAAALLERDDSPGEPG